MSRVLVLRVSASLEDKKELRDPPNGWVPQPNSIKNPGAHGIPDRSLEQATGSRLLIQFYQVTAGLDTW